LFTQRRLVSHIQRLARDIGFIANRADLNTQGAAGAIFRRHLIAHVPASRVILAARGDMLESRRRIFRQFSRENLGADGRMRANENALAALRA
jgi:hypothetical protein